MPEVGPSSFGDQDAERPITSIGETFLDEDYASAPATRGRLPPVTAELAWACFEQVGPWLAWARQALAADDWDVRTVTEVLAALGVWVDDEDYPRQHVP